MRYKHMASNVKRVTTERGTCKAWWQLHLFQIVIDMLVAQEQVVFVVSRFLVYVY